MIVDGFRTIPTSNFDRMITRLNRLEKVAQAARALLEYDKATSALSEGSDHGALSIATQLFEASFDVLENALMDLDADESARAALFTAPLVDAAE